jgi:hypothetical protein
MVVDWISGTIITLFCLAMLANVIALVRHWQALRAFHIMMSHLAETQRQFNEIMENEQRKISKREEA